MPTHISNEFSTKIDNYYYDEFTHHAIRQGQTIFVIIFFFSFFVFLFSFVSFVSRNYSKQYPLQAIHPT